MGGLGEVHLAEDTELHRQVALKRIQGRYARDPESRRRFLREAEITARLAHPGVVPIYGLADDGSGQACYAMRFIEGESLKEAIERFHGVGPPGEPRPDLRQLLGRFIAVCNAVAYAHSRGIVHRDLKPANVMLGKYSETLVVDWGLAKPFERTEVERVSGEDTLAPAAGNCSEAATQQGQALGTPEYMSPEQAAGQWDRLGPASDIFGLGATLYAILTGQPPFRAHSLEEVLQKARRCDYPPPRLVKKDVPRPLQAVSVKAMAPQPENRYQSALDLAGDLERWLADKPVRAYREPWTARLGRLMRRHPTYMTLIQVVGFVAAIALVGYQQLPYRAKEREFDRYKREAQRSEGEAKKQLEGARAMYRLTRAALDDSLRLQQDPRLQAGAPEDRRRRVLQTEEVFLQKLVTQLGHEPDYQDELAKAYWRLGEVSQQLGPTRLGSAVMYYHCSLDIEDELARRATTPTSTPDATIQAALAKRRAILLDTNLARQLAEQARQNWGQRQDRPGGTLYDLACLYSRTSSVPAEERADTPSVSDDQRNKRVEQLAARAVTLLRRAAGAGFFKTGADIDGIKNNPDLNALRRREDFRKLLNELEQEVKAGTK
jgi:tRNA A-37 threonylcarbamoyl transferase component Bud32